MDIVVSGIRPTGKLHIGHYFGVIEKWLELQEQYLCVFIIADMHAAIDIKDNATIDKYTKSIQEELIRQGIKEENIYLQSAYQHKILPIYWKLSCIASVNELSRTPAIKDKKYTCTSAMLNYPILQAADIIAFSGNIVPVGLDQLPHLEYANRIIERCNKLFNTDYRKIKPVSMKEAVSIPGTDGRKMSKSYANSIYLYDTKKISSIERKVNKMITDTNKIHIGDKGQPHTCNVYKMHKSLKNNNIELYKKCSNGGIGCVECKKNLSQHIFNIFNEGK